MWVRVHLHCKPTTEIRFTLKSRSLIQSSSLLFFSTYIFHSLQILHISPCTHTDIQKKKKKKKLRKNTSTVSLPFLPVFFKPNNEHVFTLLSSEIRLPNPKQKFFRFPTKQVPTFPHKLSNFFLPIFPRNKHASFSHPPLLSPSPPLLSLSLHILTRRASHSDGHQGLSGPKKSVLDFMDPDR